MTDLVRLLGVEPKRRVPEFHFNDEWLDRAHGMVISGWNRSWRISVHTETVNVFEGSARGWWVYCGSRMVTSPDMRIKDLVERPTTFMQDNWSEHRQPGWGFVDVIKKSDYIGRALLTFEELP